MNDPMNSTLADGERIDLLEVLRIIFENIKLLVLGSLAIGLITFGISFLVAPTYVAVTKFLPPQQQQSTAAAMLQNLGALSGLAGVATGIKNPNDQYVAFLQSRTLQERIIERFKLMDRYDKELKDDARQELDEHALISSSKDGLISVQFEDHDPVFAADVANAYIEELGQLLNRLAVTEAQQRRMFFEQQLLKTKSNLAQTEAALQAAGISANTLKNSPEAIVGAIAQLQAQIAAQEVKVASMRGYLTEQAPDFRQALTELAALRSQLASAERSQSPRDVGNADYVARYRDYKYHETLFELFAKQYEIARVDESREGAVIQVLDTAQPPQRKDKPRRGLIAALATFASGLILLLFVFVRQSLRNASQDPDTAAKLNHIRESLGLRV